MPNFGYGEPMTRNQLEHYRKVKKARKEQGLPVLTDQAKWDRRANEDGEIGMTNRFGREQVEGNDHPLLGMRIRDTEEDRTMTVDSVSNCWLDGFYIQMVVREEETNSHALIFWENINSENPGILKSIEEARSRYKKV